MNRLIEVYKLNEKLSSLVSYMLVAGMLFCLGITAQDLIMRILPDRNLAYLPYFCLFTSLVGIYSQRRIHHSSDLDINPVVYRLVEWVVLLVLLKLTIYTMNGLGQLFADLPRWQSDFIGSFFDVEYIMDVIVVLCVWTISLVFVEDLIDLEGDVNILQATSLDMVVSNRSLVQGRMANRVMTVGVGLVILATISRLDYSALPSKLELAKQSYTHILAYFLLGLVLLSLTQLATRRAVWAWEHIPVGDKIARNWVAYSLIFLIVMSILAFTLPTNYTLGFLPTLRYFIGLIIGLAYTLVLFIFLPIYLFIGWIISLLAPDNMPATPITPPELIIPPLPADLAASPAPILAILKSVLFWGILLVVIVYAFLVYLRQNRELIQKLRRMPGLSWLVKTWRWLVMRARGGMAFLPKAVQVGLERLRASIRREQIRSMGGFISLRNLKPRQKILFYYLALVRRSAEAGLPRKPWQTPDNFANTLGPNMPGAESDIESMTRSFIEARYTRHLIDSEQVGNVQRAWEHLRAILNQRRKR